MVSQTTDAQKDSAEESRNNILYTVDEVPPWYLCILLAFQQFLTCFGATFGFPILISGAVCLSNDLVGQSELIGTIVFISGLSTLLQTTFGVRLPIIQSVSYSFVTPIFVLMKANGRECPSIDHLNGSAIPDELMQDIKDTWHANLAELQGCLMIASAVQIVVGFSGLIGFLMRFIGPLTIAPTISLIGLSLFKAAPDKAAPQWWVAIMTIFLVVLFSQYLRNIELPLPCLNRKIRFFALFPVLMGIIISWLICLILTETNVFPDDKTKWGYGARTDIKTDALHESNWFRFPYPGQWGIPAISVGGILGMLAATIASMIESVGDYYACARLSGAATPTGSAVSRGIGLEGITCLLAGAWGVGAGNTSYSECIGAIGITKVGSRVVIQVAGLIMILLGCLGKFGALFVMIPDPIIGGLFYVMFGMVTAVGVSNLQFVDLNSTRNLFVFGFSLFFGLSFPEWVGKESVHTGNDTANNILNVLFGTNMFVGGVIAFFLDNTIPGTREERGFLGWEGSESDISDNLKTYDIPLIQPCLDRHQWPTYIPFCPRFIGNNKRGDDSHDLHQPQEAGLVNGKSYEGNRSPEDKTDISHENKPSGAQSQNEAFVPDNQEKQETQL